MKGSLTFLLIILALTAFDKANSAITKSRSIAGFEKHLENQDFSFKDEILRDIQYLKKLQMIKKMHKMCLKTQYANLCQHLKFVKEYGTNTDRLKTKHMLLQLSKVL